MTTFWWVVVGCVCAAVAAMALRRKPPEGQGVVVSPEEILTPSLPSVYNTGDEIEIFGDGGSAFQIQCTDGTALYLKQVVAIQIHRYLAPLQGCACSCKKEDNVLTNPLQVVERDGKLFYETKTSLRGPQVFEVSPDIVAIRDDRNTTLALDLSAARKLHALLRPELCKCECYQEGSPAAISIPRA